MVLREDIIEKVRQYYAKIKQLQKEIDDLGRKLFPNLRVGFLIRKKFPNYTYSNWTEQLFSLTSAISGRRLRRSAELRCYAALWRAHHLRAPACDPALPLAVTPLLAQYLVRPFNQSHQIWRGYKLGVLS